MYLVSVDFSENNLLAEQLNVRSLYDLPVLNYSLLNLQLMRLADLCVDVVYVIGQTQKTEDSLFRIESVENDAFLKALFKSDSKTNVLLFRNDAYFENDFSQYENIVGDDEILAFGDEKGNCYAVITSVGRLIKLYNKNIGIKNLIQEGRKFADVYIDFDGYKNILFTVTHYRTLLHDILNKRTIFRPPYIAEGIFTSNNISKGDFSIIPPVYLGDMVQIESGSTIGPNTVVYNNVLVSENTLIKNSIAFDDVYVSSGCFLDGVVCCENSSIKRNSAVFSGCIVGESALIGEDMLVENNSIIQPGVKYDDYVMSPVFNNYSGTYCNKFQGISPDKAVLLGSGIANVFKRPKIIIASDKAPNSMFIKLALLSGLMASGAECIDLGNTIKSVMFFSCSFCECSYSVYISSKGGETDIGIFDSEGNELRRADYINLLSFYNSKEFLYAKEESCKNVRQIHGLRQLYIRELTSIFSNTLNVNVVVSCNCNILKKTIDEILSRVICENCSEEKYYININDVTGKLSLKYKNKAYDEKILRKLIHFYIKNCDNQNIIENIYYKKFWNKDSIFLLMYTLFVLDASQKDIEKMVNELPDFFIVGRNVDKRIKSGELAKKISTFDDVIYQKGSFNIPCAEGKTRVSCDAASKKMKVLCASESMNISNELCDFFSKFLT